MGKKNKEALAMKPETVAEEVKQNNILDKDLRTRLEKEIQDEKDDRIVRETKARITKIEYIIKRGVHQQGRMESQRKLGKYNVTQLGRLARLLAGFIVTEQIVNEYAKIEDDILKLETVKDGKLFIKFKGDDGKEVERSFSVGDDVPAAIDYNQFDEGLSKLDKEIRSRQEKIEEKFNSDMVVLQKEAGEYWRDDWRTNINIVTGTGIKNTRWGD